MGPQTVTGVALDLAVRLPLPGLSLAPFLLQDGEELGLPASRMQVHSLRLGGATALWAATGNLALVKRVGRWTSDAVHRYLQDDAIIMRGA